MSGPTDIAFKTASELARLIRTREIGSLELTERYIERIERLDGEINAVVVRDFDGARAAARTADARLAAGEPVGPLHGVPMTIKESYNVAGLPTTWGIPLFKDNVATHDAEVVTRLRRAGALFLGKTNVPFSLGDFQSYNDLYGVTRNPWDLERTPGGSSGGSAAALAAGLAGLECGSDIGGSIRNPAHCCGVYGHKPTWGVVPPQGHALPGMDAAADLVVCGPLARSADDLALAMDVIAGPQPLDAPGWQLRLPAPKTSLRQYRIAVWPTDAYAPVDSEVADRVARVGETLARLGARVSDTARPAFDVEASCVTYLSLLNAIVGAGFSEQERARLRQRADAADPADRSHETVTVRGCVLSHRDWLIHNNARERLRRAWRAFFDDWDVLLCPQSATTAFPHDHGPLGSRTLPVNGQQQPYFRQLFWAGLITAPFLPSTVFPTGPSRAGLPIGVQAVAAEYHDRSTMEIARMLASELGGFQPPPGFAER
jgi:amidase